jgi:eukaryotic-like serine/threonine-protein kinase
LASDTNPIAAGDGPDPERLLGQTLGDRYRLVQTLGSGAMGDVYLAEHVVLGKKLAVKVLKPGLTKNEEVAQRFQQEAVAASNIGHENIVDAVDFGRTPDGSMYFVMEALQGKTLRELAEGSQLTLKRSLRALLQVSRALDAAHARGIVHRDLKLDNVMLVTKDDGRELAKVLDFGISKVTGPREALQQRVETQAGVVLGTPDYMSPEQIRGETVDQRADIYALGVMTYELSCGSVPFEAPNMTGVMMKHLGEVAVPPSQRRPELGLPPELDALVLRALEKDPARRFQTMTEFRDALSRVLEVLGDKPEVIITPPPAASATMVDAPRALATNPSTPLPDTYVAEEDVREKVRATVERARAKKAAAAPQVERPPLKFFLGGLAILVAGAVGWNFYGPASKPEVALPAVAPTPAAAPAPALPPAPAPPLTAAVVVAPGPEPAPAPAPAPREPPAIERLTSADVARVFGPATPKLTRCLESNRALLTSKAGRLELTFTVKGTGLVSDAKVNSPLDAAIAGCVVGHVKKLRFPRHRQPEQTFDLPLNYALKD